MMCNNQKGFPTVFAFAMVTLLSCCFSPVSSFFALPRVTRTSDAIIIDYDGVGYSPLPLDRGYSQVVDPGFVPLPALNPNGMFFGGWSHFGRQTAPPARSEISDRAVEGAAGRPFPFLVVLTRRIGLCGRPANTFFCSGTLISNARVLLAAQCLEQMSVHEISDTNVLIGLASISATSSVVYFTRQISQVVIHSGYNAATYANDIAIIRLNMPVNFITNRVAAAALPPASTDPDHYIDQTALVMGWGPAAAGAASTAYKQGSVLIVANDQECMSQPGYGPFVTVNNICVTGTGVTTPAYTCAADVGGPVVINTAPPTPGTPPVWTVVGINSFTPADACTASPRRHGLKTRVSAFAAWIATNIV